MLFVAKWCGSGIGLDAPDARNAGLQVLVMVSRHQHATGGYLKSDINGAIPLICPVSSGGFMGYADLFRRLQALPVKPSKLKCLIL